MEETLTILHDADQLEFHYQFGDDDKTHTLNAYTRNAYEKELLGIIKTLSTELGLHVEVETEAKQKGGLIDFYNFIVSDQGVAIVEWATFFLVLFISIFPRKTHDEKINEQLDIITKYKELQDKGFSLPQNIENRINKLYSNHKIKKQKSNFFKKLMQEKKVNISGVGFIDRKIKFMNLL